MPPEPHRIALLGLLTNVALATTKLIAGILGHSGALIADAIESLGDIAGSLVIYSALRLGARPPDDDHPYGHGKAEALAGLVVATLMLVASLAISVEAIHDIRTPHPSPAPFTLAVLLAVILIKSALFAIAGRTARRAGSDAVRIDAVHHIADAITSLAAFIGISIALFGQRLFPASGLNWPAADDYAALFAAVIIAANAVILARLPLAELMDAAKPEDEARILAPAREIARAVPGVLAIEKLHARKAGSRYWLDMHVQVHPELPIRHAHAISGQVRATLRAKLPTVADALIHIEPHEEPTPK